MGDLGLWYHGGPKFKGGGPKLLGAAYEPQWWHVNESNVAKEGLNLSEEGKRRKVYILQTIRDYKLNLTLIHRK